MDSLPTQYWKYWNSAPEIIIKIERISADGVWVIGESGKRYLVPHYQDGEAQEATLRIING